MDERSPIGVIVVDDHLMFAESVARLLAVEADIEVVGIATTGAEALRVIAARRPDVVLVDYRLPDQDGVAIASEVKRMDPTIMVVMLTGSTDDRILVSAIEAGCSGFLTKDRAASEIAIAIRAVAAGEALISPAQLARLLPKLNRSYRSVGFDLTDREREVLGHLAGGATAKAIASLMHLSVNTIRNYSQSVLVKLGAHSKLEAVSIAIREGIIDYPTST